MAAAASAAVVLPAGDFCRRFNSNCSKLQDFKTQLWGSDMDEFIKLNAMINPHKSSFSSNNSRSNLPIVNARLFSPAIFEASKLKVLLLRSKSPQEILPRAYTVTHCDMTSKITLAISESINNSQIQGWYNKLQRDEVLAEWKRCQGSMSLHVHCHISGGHWLLDAIAQLRYYIFRKELPVVLQAFIHGDESLFKNHPELQEAMTWIYFHSNLEQFNIVECWGSLKEAANCTKSTIDRNPTKYSNYLKRPVSCPHRCDCCAPCSSVIPIQSSLIQDYWHGPNIPLSTQEQQQSTDPTTLTLI